MKANKKVYVGETPCGCGCGYYSSNPTFIETKEGKVIEEQVLAQSNNPKNLIQKVSIITTLDKEDKNYQKYKQILGAQN
ncbi:MAG: hypothetical protein AABX88_02250 [Nanoarchaeota archaeon]